MSDIAEQFRLRVNVGHGDTALVPLVELRDAIHEIARLKAALSEAREKAIEEVEMVAEPKGEQPCPGCDYRGSGCDCPQGGEAPAWDARDGKLHREFPQ